MPEERYGWCDAEAAPFSLVRRVNFSVVFSAFDRQMGAIFFLFRVLRMAKSSARSLLLGLFIFSGMAGSVYALDGVSRDVPSGICRQNFAPHLTTVALGLKHGKFDAGGEDGAQPELNAASETDRARWQRSVYEGSAWAAFNWGSLDGVRFVTVQYGFENETDCEIYPAQPVRISPIYLPEKVARYLVKQQGGNGKGDLKQLRGKVQHILTTWNSEPQKDEGEDYHADDAATNQVAANTSEATIGGAQFSMLKGSCDKLVIGRDKYTTDCDSEVISTAYPDRRVGFYFSTRKHQVFTFSGMDGENPTKDADVTLIDKVILNLEGKETTAVEVKASGKCIYGNPYTGEPMTIACSGKLRDGRTFSAIFTTDGAPPR